MNKKSVDNVSHDIEFINSIKIVPTLLNVISRNTQMRFVAIARVTDAQWITCAALDQIDFGLKPGDELELDTTICNEIRQHRNPVVIDDVEKDPDYCRHPTPLRYGFKSYISYPIFRRDGQFFGTLCAIDPNPAKLNVPEVMGMFESYAELIAFHLETAEALETAQSDLQEERRISELRETFIAILGHDLRSPISSSIMSATLLLKAPLQENEKRLVQIIKSSSHRVQGLIENLLDFARGQLGDGIEIKPQQDNAMLEDSIKQVIDEMQVLHPRVEIKTSAELNRPVFCDHNKIAQLFSNLLGNAIKHGEENEPVLVEAKTENDQFTLAVANKGDEIPKEFIPDLFKPFFKKDSQRNKRGLGLGLYISSEIAKAHEGTIAVSSNQAVTRFALQIPLK